MNKTILKKLAHGLGEHNFYAVTNDFNVVPLSNSDPRTISEISGAYAKYKEGIFAVWCDSEIEEIWLTCNGSSTKLSLDCKLTWQSKLFSRKFSVETDSGQFISFRYKTLIYEPWRLITDLFIPNDDWGLVFDLPSFVHSSHLNGTLKEDIKNWVNKAGNL